jgi:hypothetical protein
MYSTFYSRLILMKLESDQQISKENSNIKFQKIRPVGAELFHTQADRRTHISKLQSLFAILRQGLQSTE